MLETPELPDQQVLRLLVYLKHSPVELVGMVARRVTVVILATKALRVTAQIA
jgi:hypothetical protein